jgi:hypothetical protein
MRTTRQVVDLCSLDGMETAFLSSAGAVPPMTTMRLPIRAGFMAVPFRAMGKGQV